MQLGDTELSEGFGNQNDTPPRFQVQEDKVMPYMSASSVSKWIQARFGVNDTRASKRSTWFFQQFLKLAVASSIPELSETFLVWDSKQGWCGALWD